MTHCIEAIQLADLAARATDIAKRSDRYARIVAHEGTYKAVPADAPFGTDVYVAFSDGVVEPWDEVKFDEYDDRAKDLIIE